MTFAESIRTVVVEKFATFSGRACRSEFWWFQLFSIGISIVLTLLGVVTGAAVLFEGIDTVFSWALLVPTLAVTCRRLHDINRTGWWQVVPLIPALPAIVIFVDAEDFTDPLLLGLIVATAAVAIVLLVWLIRRGDEGPNDYGEDPFGISDAEIFS